MMQTRLAMAVAAALGWLAFTQASMQEPPNTGASMPLADHHQYLFSPELAALMTTTAPVAAVKPRAAADPIAELDAPGIKRAVVLSMAYIFEQPSRNAGDAEEKLKRDNDWTSKQGRPSVPFAVLRITTIRPGKAGGTRSYVECVSAPAQDVSMHVVTPERAVVGPVSLKRFPRALA